MSGKQLENKIVAFLKNNFPEPRNYDIITMSEDLSKIVLDYGNDKMQISIGLDNTTASMFKLLETKFIA